MFVPTMVCFLVAAWFVGMQAADLKQPFICCVIGGLQSEQIFTHGFQFFEVQITFLRVYERKHSPPKLGSLHKNNILDGNCNILLVE